MLYMEEHRRTIVGVAMLYLPKPQALSIYGLWRKWEKEHGPLWLVGRLRLMAQLLLNPDLDCAVKRTATGRWVGPMKAVYDLANRDRAGLRDACRILRLTGTMEAKNVTNDDYEANFRKIEVAEPPLLPPYAFVTDLVTPRDKENAKEACKKALAKGFQKIQPRRLGVKTPITPFRVKDEYNVSYKEHLQTMRFYPGIIARHYDFFNNIVELALPSVYETLDNITPRQYAGRCSGLTKDRSLKRRFIYNPFGILQLSLSRLYVALVEYCRTLPGFWVWDQEGGREWVVTQLAEGEEMSSIDLSSASDFVPLEPQIELLKFLFPALTEDIEIFAEVSRLYWGSPTGAYGKHTIGQGMGVKVSFLSFSLYLYTLCETVVSRRKKAVVGDDLAIAGRREIGYKTSNLLTSVGIPINYTKSLMQARVGEFLGALLDEIGNLGAFKSSKEYDIVKDPLGNIVRYGPRAQVMWPRKGDLRRRLKIIAAFPEPIGLGLNPGILSRIPADVLNEIFSQTDRGHIPLLERMPLEQIEREYRSLWTTLDALEDRLPTNLPTAEMRLKRMIEYRELALEDIRKIRNVSVRMLKTNLLLAAYDSAVHALNGEGRDLTSESEGEIVSSPEGKVSSSLESYSISRSDIRAKMGWSRAVMPNDRLIVEHVSAIRLNKPDIVRVAKTKRSGKIFHKNIAVPRVDVSTPLDPKSATDRVVDNGLKVLVHYAHKTAVAKHRGGVHTLHPEILVGSREKDREEEAHSGVRPRQRISLIRRLWNKIAPYFRSN